jgi:hypothetical protein
MIAALFVAKGGTYFGLPNVDPWDEERDARLYEGPHAVVAHPPCERWGNYWFGSPSDSKRFKLGDDGGCFDFALRAVRQWGGVIEHPAGSRAWKAFGLRSPADLFGWTAADTRGGWTCQVDQAAYGHDAAKSTWLYAQLSTPRALPELLFGPTIGRRPLEHLSHRQRAATPPAFRDLLIGIAESVRS